MAEFEAPTFSLGFDFGFDSEPQHTKSPDPRTSRSFCTIEDDTDEEFGPEIADSDPDTDPEAPRVLKRLRRGARTESASKKTRTDLPDLCVDGDDEIEDFSSPEDFSRDEPPSTGQHSMCSSSKFPLQGYRQVLCTHGTGHSKVRKPEHVFSAPTSGSSGTRTGIVEFPKLTISPLRKFQLIDSDSDDIYGDENESKSSKKTTKPNPGQSTTMRRERKIKTSNNMTKNEDLWKDLSPVKSFCIPTPALDEVCDEYYRSLNQTNVPQKAVIDAFKINKDFLEFNNSSQNLEHNWNSTDPLPPAHRYFFHEDPSIQRLVRTRLSNFSPLGAVNTRTTIPGAPVIDYMSQFTHGESSRKQATLKKSTEKTSTRGRKNSKKAISEDPSESWVNPRSQASTPKDASRRRVHADGQCTGQSSGQSAGRWFTGQEGKRVYVTKSGQELSGQTAYRHYKKESGAKFRKSKKKPQSKK